jgi:transketolase
MSAERIIGQRDAYFEELFKIFKADKNCVLITADNGAPTLDAFAAEIPKQYITVGIAEQAMISMAAGMAHEGKRVWTYCIAPFATTRVHEFVKLDVAAMKLPITILGVGAGYAYDIMGPTHHTLEDISIMRTCCGLEIYSPADSVCGAALAKLSYERLTPKYIRFDRAGIPNIYKADEYEFKPLTFLYPNWRKVECDAWIVSTGIMTHTALKVSEFFLKEKLEFGVVDVARLWPFDKDEFLSHIGQKNIITLEEHFLSGGLGSIVSEVLHDADNLNSLLRIGIPDVYHFEPWGRDEAHKKYGLDTDAVIKRIMDWL